MTKEITRSAIYNLDWSQIFVRAIKMRPTAFGLQNGVDEDDIRVHLAETFPEWRNSKDEIAGSLITELVKERYLEPQTPREREKFGLNSGMEDDNQ